MSSDGVTVTETELDEASGVAISNVTVGGGDIRLVIVASKTEKRRPAKKPAE